MGKDGEMETGNSHGLNGRNGLKRIFLWDEEKFSRGGAEDAGADTV